MRILRTTVIRNIDANITNGCNDTTGSRCVFREKSEGIRVVTEQKAKKINDRFEVQSTVIEKFTARESSIMNCGFEMLELQKVHRFRGGSEAVVVAVEVVADRFNCALDVHLCHGGHHEAKFEVALVTCFESMFLTFAHLVLISCVHEICIHEAHE